MRRRGQIEDALREDTEPLTVRASIRGKVVQVTADTPIGPTRTVRSLPVLHQLTDAVVSRAVGRTQGRGARISCKSGCGACCRQLVPISETEARALADLVDDMPEPRRSMVRRRFAELCTRVEEGGLSRLIDSDTVADDECEAVALAWFALGVPCPFLEEESCSIHAVRPSVCREYLVTSDAEQCARPTPETIEHVSLDAEISDAMDRRDAREAGRRNGWVPLGLALEWVERNAEEPPPRPALELVKEVLDLAVGGKRRR